MSIHSATVKDNLLTVTIRLASAPYISESEKAKAVKEGREPVAHMLASSGGFARLPSGQRISFNVMD